VAGGDVLDEGRHGEIAEAGELIRLSPARL
jgi:hypothetical protein